MSEHDSLTLDLRFSSDCCVEQIVEVIKRRLAELDAENRLHGNGGIELIDLAVIGSDSDRKNVASIPNTSQVERYYEFVGGLKKVSPIETEFKLGQVVAFVNDHGVIFPGREIIGFADDDSFYGRFIYLNTDCYWFPVRPGSLRVMDEDGNFEIREGEVVYEPFECGQ